jgi:hypothetical protein
MISPNYSVTLGMAFALESLPFIGTGLWRFSREEF